MPVTSVDLDQRIVASVSSRYSDAYIVARTINALGQTVKIGGMILAGIILLGSLVVGSRSGVGGLFAFAGFTMAVVVAAVFYLFGTLTSAQGQILMATLDTAVNSSPLLSTAERARLVTMSSSESLGQRPYSTHISSAASTGPWKCGCGQQNPADQDACLDCGVARALATT